ncbi:hypothetical protein JCM11251_003476 [Rhodosporidiobolus azoricus]
MSYGSSLHAAAPRASGLLAFKDVEKPPRPEGIPLPGLYDAFMNPWTPLIFGLLYFVTAKTLSHYQNGKNRIRGPFWDFAVVAHNVFLAAYSAWTFVGTAPQVFGAFWRGFASDGLPGLTHAFCDSQLAIWGSETFPKYTYVFYLSKYYEIVDTAILLLKGKKVGMLQSYHHCGAIWTMFAGYRAQAMPIWLFCVFNSFIHTIMYCYYAVTSLKLPFPQFLKRNITRLQITQFLLGGSLAASYLFVKLPDLPSLSTHLPASLSDHLPTMPSIDEAAAAASAGWEAGKEQFSAAFEGFEGGWEAGLEAVKREGEKGAQCLVNAAQRSAVCLG